MVLSLCTQLKGLGCEPVIGVFNNRHRPNLDAAHHAKELGLRNAVFDCRRKLDTRTLKFIREFVFDNQIEVVHTHGYKADIYGYIAVRNGRSAIVATSHSWTERRTSTSFALQLYGFLDRKVLKNFDVVVPVSNSIGTLLHQRGIPRENMRVISNGVDIDLFSKACPNFRAESGAGNRPIVGMIGRLVTAKGPDIFLKAATGVLRDFPEAIFVLVGDGPDRERLEKVAKSLAVGASVIFAGRRDDMPSIYASLDVMVLPSLTEGMPMVILEAMAAAKAIIATRVGGIPSLVVPEKTGILVQPGDSDELRIAIARLLADPGLRTQLGDAAQMLARERYTSRIMAENYLATYRQALLKVESRQSSESKGGA